MIKNKSILSAIYMIQDYSKGSHFLEETVDRVLNELKLLDKELEALQQRSCEECVHRSFIDEALTNKVTNGFCIENGFFTKRDFCCNRYEAKGAMR